MLEGWYFGVRDTKDKKGNGPERSQGEQESFSERGTLMDKASTIQWNSNADALRDARASESSKEDLQGVETTMRYGLFCLTFMYFRMHHVLRKEKASWDDSNDLVSLRHGPPVREKRKKMIRGDHRVGRLRNN